jgi:4-hydroxybenzoate polyprenyltransferase
VPVWVLVALVSSNTLSGYTATGNVVMVVLFMFFALWAWWYAEDRDRRSAPSEPPRRPDADSG